MHIDNRMRVDSLENVDEIDIGVDLMKSASCKKRLNPSDGSCTKLGPTEHPVLSSEGNRSDLPFEMVRVDRHGWVFEEHPEPALSLERGKRSPSDVPQTS